MSINFAPEALEQVPKKLVLILYVSHSDTTKLDPETANILIEELQK
jgi:hypothetical protein